MAVFKRKVDESLSNESMENEDLPVGLPDYDCYVMGGGEKIMYMALAAVVLFGVGYVFYKSVILSCLMMIFAVKFPAMRTKQIIANRKRDLTVQFKDMLYSLSSSLTAGKSVDTGLRECLNDLRIIYPDENTMIIQELSYIIHGLDMSNTVEDMFNQFAERSHVEDIENFADIFRTCKHMGGDMVQVIKSTSQTIGEKIEVKQEIETMIAGKKYEFKVLMVMPIFLILILTYTSGDYMAPVFGTFIGRIVMTIAIALFVAAYFVGEKIMKIEV